MGNLLGNWPIGLSLHHTTSQSEWVSLQYLYSVGLVMFDRFSATQCLCKCKLRSGWISSSFFHSILSSTGDLLCVHRLIRISLTPFLRVPLQVIPSVLFLLLFLLLLRVCVSFSLAVLCQLERERDTGSVKFRTSENFSLPNVIFER